MRLFMVSVPRWVSGVVTLLIVAGACAFAAYCISNRAPAGPSTYAYDSAESSQAQEVYWQGRISTVGGPAAYAEFTQWVARQNPSDEHLLAHAFGDALYDVVGESGLSVCDGQVSYGCFHAIVGHTIAEHGLPEVASLIKNCQRIGTDLPSCQHGIGHGIAGYFGYDKEDLDKALAVCKKEAIPDPVDSCYSGVFMEYSMRTMIGVDAARPVGNDMLAPCNSVAAEYQQACASQQPRWWVQALYKHAAPDAAMYERMGALCDQLTQESSALRTCYEALGAAAPALVGYVPGASAMLCAASSPSKLHQLFCVSYVASEIADSRTQQDGSKACAALAGTALTYCTAYATKQASLINPLPSPDL